MNFGRLTLIINDIQNELNILTNQDNTKSHKTNNIQLFNQNTIQLYAVTVYQNIKDTYPEISLNNILDIFTRFFKNKYEFTSKLNFENGKKCFRNLDTKFTIDEINTSLIKIPKKYQKLEKHFQELFHTPQPEQRTKEWFDFRYKRVTASDMATALDLNPYEPVETFIIKKCDPDFPFLDNKFVHHGKKYEPTATMIYEHIYNVKVTEFGILSSPKYPILAASPDGICSKSTLDGKFTDMLGTMLEIKCPFSRSINTKGKIAGVICPYYYYCQVQQQLECCELSKCDFWQCNIVEYNSRNEFIQDINFNSVLTEGTEGEKKEIDPLITRGCIIQLLPYDFTPTHSEDMREYKGSFLYPPRLDLTIEEYDNWVVETIANWQIDDPELAKKYYFDKVIYWKLPNSHNVTIHRDKEWFLQIYPILNQTWENVEYYRNHPEELPFLKKKAEKRKRFYRYKTKFELNKSYDGTNVVENKILFLNDIVVNNSDEEDYDVDFVD